MVAWLGFVLNFHTRHVGSKKNHTRDASGKGEVSVGQNRGVIERIVCCKNQPFELEEQSQEWDWVVFSVTDNNIKGVWRVRMSVAQRNKPDLTKYIVTQLSSIWIPTGDMLFIPPTEQWDYISHPHWTCFSELVCIKVSTPVSLSGSYYVSMWFVYEANLKTKFPRYRGAPLWDGHGCSEILKYQKMVSRRSSLCAVFLVGWPQ